MTATERITAALDAPAVELERVRIFTQSVDASMRSVLPGGAIDQARKTVENEIWSLAQAGKPIPDDIARPIVEARLIDEARLERALVINQVVDHLEQQRAEVERDNTGAAFDQMQVELDAIWAQVNELRPDLQGASTADEVISAGSTATKAWTRLRELAAEYSAVRTLQFKLSRSANPELMPFSLVFTSCAMFRDAIEFHPAWLQSRTDAMVPNPLIRDDAEKGLLAWLAKASTIRRWTDTENRAWSNGWWPVSSISHEAFLLWLTANTTPFAARPADMYWISAAGVAATAKLKKTSSNLDQVAGLAQYYRLTGGTPPFDTDLPASAGQGQGRGATRLEPTR